MKTKIKTLLSNFFYHCNLRKDKLDNLLIYKVLLDQLTLK